MPQLNREDEAERLIRFYGEDAGGKIMETLERQFVILHNRAQVLLGLCGIVVTTAGFSGRFIAETGPWSQVLIVVGVALALLAAAVVVYGVLHLRWLSQQDGQLLRPWLLTCLAYRDRKTNFYRAAILILLVGLTAYVAALSIMLLNPH